MVDPADAAELPTTKQCRVCGSFKPATTENFAPVQNGRYLNSYCRPCAKLVRKAQYEDGGREAMKAVAAARSAAGLCTKCGDQPPVEGGTTCEPCRVKGRQASAKSRQKRMQEPTSRARTLERQRAYYAANPERWKQYRRRRQSADKILQLQRRFKRYGLTSEEYTHQVERQGGRCPICSADLREVRSVVDHCHETNMPRGVLCSNCNVGLGMFGHDAATLRDAMRYLEAYLWPIGETGSSR